MADIELIFAKNAQVGDYVVDMEDSPFTADPKTVVYEVTDTTPWSRGS